MKPAYGIALAAFAGFLFLRSDPAKAAQVSIAEQDTSDAPREADSNTENVSIDMSDEVVNPSENVNVNLAAFLYVIRASEHVFPRDVDDCYDIFYGGSRFNDFSDHPVLTGEKKGIPLADHICAASGLGPGCVSTAAGAYQIIKPTWRRIREIAPRLEDFSPASQDEAARRLADQIDADHQSKGLTKPLGLKAMSELVEPCLAALGYTSRHDAPYKAGAIKRNALQGGRWERKGWPR